MQWGFEGLSSRASALALTFHGAYEGSRDTGETLDPGAQRYAINARLLAEALQGISANDCCTVSEFADKSRGDWLIMTFDDGLKSDYETAFPILAGKGIKTTFFVTARNVGKPGFATWANLKEMAGAGMEIGSHGLTHRYLVTMPRSEALREIRDSKKELEERLGLEVRSFAPVGGHFNIWMVNAVREAGYKVFATMIPGWTRGGERFLKLRRNHIQAHHDLNYVAGLLRGDKKIMLTNRLRYYLLRIPKVALGMRNYDRIKGLVLRK